MIKKIIKNLDELKKFSQEIEKNIFGFSNILIYGEVGAGKTTFTKFFLENIGVEKKIKSPSYALENFYEIKNSKKYGKFWHYDIYRLENSTFESLEENFESDNLVIVERAEKLKKKPQSGIELFFKKLEEKNPETGENLREIKIKFFGTSFFEEEIGKIFKKYKTPKNIQGHTAQVANTAMQVAEIFLKNGKILDKKLIYTGAKLHDLVKYIDFIDKINKKNGEYFDINGNKIDKEIVLLWKKIKEKFFGLTHEKAGKKLFYEMGFKEIGKVIGSHGLNQAFEGFSTFEEKIVYYSDSVTMHHKKVSVRERIEDVKNRYGKDKNGIISDEKNIFYEKLIEKNSEVEKELENFIL